MKTFASRKAQELFLEILESISKDPNSLFRRDFSNEVKDLFWKKNDSEEGEYTEFKVTEAELLEIAKKYQ